MTASWEACRHFLVSFSGVKDDNEPPGFVVISWFFSSNGKDDHELGGSQLVVIS
jgi:hypothetical protein